MEKNDVTWGLAKIENEGLTIIPTNYQKIEGEKFYTDSAMSFYKYARNKTDIEIYSAPDICLSQRSGDWFGPVFYVASFAIENYDIINTLLDLISGYLKETYGGKELNARFEIVAEDRKKGKFKSVKYEGPSGDIKAVLKSFDKINNG